MGHRASENKDKAQWFWTRFGALLGVGQDRSGRKKQISGGLRMVHVHEKDSVEAHRLLDQSSDRAVRALPSSYPLKSN